MTSFRDALGRFASGITVITSVGVDGAPTGFACQSFSSLSLDRRWCCSAWPARPPARRGSRRPAGSR
jgi:flavin reductase (DIM6/NTAB) family NADH-FMN oxidoreductase RutF